MVLVKPRIENISDTTTDIGHKVLISSLCCGGYHLPRSDKRRVALIGWVSFPHLLRQSLIVLRALVCSFVRFFVCLSVCLSVCLLSLLLCLRILHFEFADRIGPTGNLDMSHEKKTTFNPLKFGHHSYMQVVATGMEKCPFSPRKILKSE